MICPKCQHWPSERLAPDRDGCTCGCHDHADATLWMLQLLRCILVRAEPPINLTNVVASWASEVREILQYATDSQQVKEGW